MKFKINKNVLIQESGESRPGHIRRNAGKYTAAGLGAAGAVAYNNSPEARDQMNAIGSKGKDLVNQGIDNSQTLSGIKQSIQNYSDRAGAQGGDLKNIQLSANALMNNPVQAAPQPEPQPVQPAPQPVQAAPQLTPAPSTLNMIQKSGAESPEEFKNRLLQGNVSLDEMKNFRMNDPQGFKNFAQEKIQFLRNKSDEQNTINIQNKAEAVKDLGDSVIAGGNYLKGGINNFFDKASNKAANFKEKMDASEAINNQNLAQAKLDSMTQTQQKISAAKILNKSFNDKQSNPESFESNLTKFKQQDYTGME